MLFNRTNGQLRLSNQVQRQIIQYNHKQKIHESIGKINIILQNIGRVILNLIINAFYAITEKKQIPDGYEPTVSVSTKKMIDKVLIPVKGNGN